MESYKQTKLSGLEKTCKQDDDGFEEILSKKMEEYPLGYNPYQE